MREAVITQVTAGSEMWGSPSGLPPGFRPATRTVESLSEDTENK